MKITKKACTRLAAVIAFTGLLQWEGGAAEKDGGIVAYPARSGSQGPVLFSHLSHGPRTAGYSCDRCHADGSTRKLSITMQEINQGRGCGECHHGKTRSPGKQNSAFSVQDCKFCHMPVFDIVIRLNRMDSVAFSHARHLGVDPEKGLSKSIGFSCMHCHPEPFERDATASYGMEVPHEAGACAKCHNGIKRDDGLPVAFAATTRCLTCHKPEVRPSGASLP